MSFKSIYLFLSLLFIEVKVFAQATNENNVHGEDMHESSNADWIPGLLNAGSSTLYNFIIFNGSIISWNLRGEPQMTKMIDGIFWHSVIGDWSGGHLYSGMSQVIKKNETLLNGVISNNGHYSYPSLIVMNTENTILKKSFSMSSHFALTPNTNFSKSILFEFHSGLIGKNNFHNFAIKWEDAPAGVLPNGYKKNLPIFYSWDKKWTDHTSFGLSVLWNFSDQGRAATTTNEMFILSKQPAYSPNWGWYHNQLYFPSTRQTNAPILSFRFQKKWNDQSNLKISQGIIIGQESSSGLSWTNTADPRPDYYKYLPSYIGDSLLSKQVRDWYKQHPQNLQLNFDQMDRINKASFDKRSFYIVNQENRDLLLMHGAFLFSNSFKNNASVQIGSQYAFDQIHFFNTIKDLLGGNFYYNYNTWMNDDSLAVSFQNDIGNPNKKVSSGEKWGPDYSMRSFQFKPWIQIQKQGPRFESAISLGYGMEGIERIGYNQNGLFTNSKGSMGFQNYTTADIKGQLLYKLNGRFYIRTILFSQWIAPNFHSIFLDPDINANASPYVSQVNKYGIDFSIFYRSPNIKASFSSYQKITLKEAENKMFYHDAYGLFVYGVIGNINSIQQGLEIVIENEFIQHLKVNYATTLSSNSFIDNPNYQYLEVNHLQVKENGILQISNLPKLSEPKLVNAISLIYQPVYGFNVGVTSIYAQERSVSLNLFRRSDWVKNKLDPISWGQIHNSTLLNDQLVLNAFISKNVELKISKWTNKKIRWNMSASVRNLLNKSIPVIAYEQTRFDYLRFNKEKYAIKYLMNPGASYAIRIQIQIQ